MRIAGVKLDKIYSSRELREEGFVMSAPHCHGYFELFYPESGACSFFIGNNMYDLHAGDFLLIPPQVFHYTRYPYGACRRFNIFFRESDVAPLCQVMPFCGKFFEEIRIFQVPEAYRDQIAAIISSLLREEKIDDERSQPLKGVLLQELFLLCARECDFLSELPADIHTTDKLIVHAAQFMEQNYSEDITTDDIAAAAGYSTNYLSRKFREAAGISVHDYLVFIRLQHAALQLVSTDDSVTEIALRCGFSGGNYFKDAFKKKYGVTPSQYRK